MLRLDLTREERGLLVRILENKAKEIHAWQAATKDTRRDKEYDNAATLLKKITLIKEVK